MKSLPHRFSAIVLEDGQQIWCSPTIKDWDGSTRSLWIGSTAPIELIDAIHNEQEQVEIPCLEGGTWLHQIIVDKIDYADDEETMVPAYRITVDLGKSLYSPPGKPSALPQNRPTGQSCTPRTE